MKRQDNQHTIKHLDKTTQPRQDNTKITQDNTQNSTRQQKITHKITHDNTRQHKTTQDNTQDNTQYNTRQHRTAQDNTRQRKPTQEKTRQDKTRPLELYLSMPSATTQSSSTDAHFSSFRLGLRFKGYGYDSG